MERSIDWIKLSTTGGTGDASLNATAIASTQNLTADYTIKVKGTEEGSDWTNFKRFRLELISDLTQPVYFKDHNFESAMVKLYDTEGKGYLTYEDLGKLNNSTDKSSPDYNLSLNRLSSLRLSEFNSFTDVSELIYCTGVEGKLNINLDMRNGERVALPPGITEIGNGSAAAIGPYTKEVSFPQNLEIVNKYSFLDTGMATFNFLNTKLKKVGRWAFGNASSLNTIWFPETLEEIGEAIAGQYGILSNVWFYGPKPQYIENEGNSGVFKGRTNITAYVKRQYLEDYRNDSKFSGPTYIAMD